MADLSPEDRQRAIRDAQRYAPIVCQQLNNWIIDAARVTSCVANGNTSWGPLFWIRLYGVLFDITNYILEQVDFLNQLGAPTSDELTDLMNVLHDIRGHFTTDEGIFLQYRRHVECHPTQDAYRLLGRHKKGLRTEVRHHLIGEGLSVEETEEAIKRVLRDHNVDEKLLAQEFARRIEQSMSKLREASRLWFEAS